MQSCHFCVEYILHTVCGIPHTAYKGKITRVEHCGTRKYSVINPKMSVNMYVK